MDDKEVDEARKDGLTRRDRKKTSFLTLSPFLITFHVIFVGEDEKMLLAGFGKGSGMGLVCRRVY